MKKLLLILTFVFAVSLSFAQHGRYETDIFGTLLFKSNKDSYSASLEKNVFGDLVFSDSRKNHEKFENKYLGRFMPGILNSKDAQQKFFQELIWQNRNSEGYESFYSIDIFGTIITKDNRGNERESGTDIFGHEFVRDKSKGSTSSIKRNIHGDLEYTEDGNQATLRKDIFDKWSYSDSFGNRVEFSSRTWNRILNR
ncbi:hypothetical protein [Sphingobacterium hotanense]|uniref:Uncharacterized protein n=1 Tax=Sphingobacterium hotanense TaxID=649196 RepID=A0ABT7NKH2_9SPHI|nr:hypothetical protein [Sphingobacterium hotanense]MDM1047645.1 hypothetical protein [Sphingobacterium hotanense]